MLSTYINQIRQKEMPVSCMSSGGARVRARVHSRSRIRSPFRRSFTKEEEEERFKVSKEFSLPELSECGNTNSIMVVVDSSPESKGALDWALSHTVQSHDVIILLHVAKQEGKTNGEVDQRAYDLLRSTKNACQLKRPEVHVEMAFKEGKEKGAIIVEEAKRSRVSLLVLGHQKQSFLRRLQTVWASRRTRSRVVDYCIQNADCMTIAVRRKNRKFGGYLITTKRHKNFWLLA